MFEALPAIYAVAPFARVTVNWRPTVGGYIIRIEDDVLPAEIRFSKMDLLASMSPENVEWRVKNWIEDWVKERNGIDAKALDETAT